MNASTRARSTTRERQGWSRQGNEHTRTLKGAWLRQRRRHRRRRRRRRRRAMGTEAWRACIILATRPVESAKEEKRKNEKEQQQGGGMRTDRWKGVRMRR